MYFLTVWAGLIAAVAAAAFWSWRRTRRNPPKGASLRGIKRSIFHAAVLGSVWGTAPFVLFPGSDTMYQLFLTATMAGMISGGAFCLSTEPAAGLAYTWTMVLASATAPISAAYNVFIYTAIMLIIYAVFTSRNLVAHGRLFFDHLRYRLKA